MPFNYMLNFLFIHTKNTMTVTVSGQDPSWNGGLFCEAESQDSYQRLLNICNEPGVLGAKDRKVREASFGNFLCPL